MRRVIRVLVNIILKDQSVGLWDSVGLVSIIVNISQSHQNQKFSKSKMSLNNMNSMAQFVVFTFNNPSIQDVSAIQLMLTDKTRYAVYGMEVGEGGTPHIQGYFELDRTKRFRLSAIRKWFPRSAAHVEKRMGTPEQAIAYCKKGRQSHIEWELDGVDGDHYGDDAEVWEHGDPGFKVNKPGKRTDVERVRDGILGGEVKNEFDLLMNVSSMQGFKYGQALLNALPVNPVRPKPLVYWLFGSTGTGKSRACAEIIERFQRMRGWSFWRSNYGTDWFDGYNRQEVAWFDDFRFQGRQRDFAFLLNLLDVYPLRVPIKGGFVTWTPRVILFTAPKPMQSSFGDVDGREEIAQLERRVTESFDFDRDGGVELAVKIWHWMEDPDANSVPVQRWDLLPDYKSDSDDSDYVADDETVMSVESDVEPHPSAEEEEDAVPPQPPRLLRARARAVFGDEENEDPRFRLPEYNQLFAPGRAALMPIVERDNSAPEDDYLSDSDISL